MSVHDVSSGRGSCELDTYLCVSVSRGCYTARKFFFFFFVFFSSIINCPSFTLDKGDRIGPKDDQSHEEYYYTTLVYRDLIICQRENLIRGENFQELGSCPRGGCRGH